MREPPSDLAEEMVRARLADQYGLAVVALTFLPLGYDSAAWVYRARTADGGDYFLKARLGVTNEASLMVPRALWDQGIRRAIAPLPTTTGALWTETGGYALILYPFLEATTGMAGGLTDQQWIDYGALLRQVHDARLTPELARVMQRDDFTPAWGATVRRLDEHIGARTFDAPAARALATFWQARREEIRAVLARAEALGRRLARAAPPLMLCHADIHTGNVLVDAGGQVWFVDWDETILAPRERDLMFVIGGISSRLVGPRQEALFMHGYGATTVDRLALAYYRSVWAVGDIGAFGAEVFFRPDLGPATKRVAVDHFIGLFEPGEIVALAAASGDGTA